MVKPPVVKIYPDAAQEAIALAETLSKVQYPLPSGLLLRQLEVAACGTQEQVIDVSIACYSPDCKCSERGKLNWDSEEYQTLRAALKAEIGEEWVIQDSFIQPDYAQSDILHAVYLGTCFWFQLTQREEK